MALSKVVVALNNKGVYIMDDSDTIRMHIAFWEVATVTKGRWVYQRSFCPVAAAANAEFSPYIHVLVRTEISECFGLSAFRLVTRRVSTQGS